MDINQLLRGVGVIIDDDLDPEKGDRKDNIWEIKNILSESNIPFLEYWQIPNENVIINWNKISFLLLDWALVNLSEDDIREGITMGDEQRRIMIKDNISLIRKLQEIIFIPIFIFSKEAPDTIIRELESENLYYTSKSNFIFVKSKSDLIKKEGGNYQLFVEIEKWIKTTPSMYALKQWECSFNNAENQLFWDFYNINHNWPKILWQVYKDDKVDMSTELGELITKNLISRTAPYNFEEEILNSTGDIDKEELRKVIEGERFLDKNRLNPNVINTGDIFKKNNDYFINIRPQCDCIPREEVKINDIKLYLLEGSQVEDPSSKKNLNNIYEKNYGLFRENDSYTIIFPIKGKILKFQHKNIIIKGS